MGEEEGVRSQESGGSKLQTPNFKPQTPNSEPRIAKGGGGGSWGGGGEFECAAGGGGGDEWAGEGIAAGASAEQHDAVIEGVDATGPCVAAGECVAGYGAARTSGRPVRWAADPGGVEGAG